MSTIKNTNAKNNLKQGGKSVKPLAVKQVKLPRGRPKKLLEDAFVREQVYLPKPTIQELVYRAKRDGTTKSALVRTALKLLFKST